MKIKIGKVWSIVCMYLTKDNLDLIINIWLIEVTENCHFDWYTEQPGTMLVRPRTGKIA